MLGVGPKPKKIPIFGETNVCFRPDNLRDDQACADLENASCRTAPRWPTGPISKLPSWLAANARAQASAIVSVSLPAGAAG
jgi:hypothetical protein